jgi:hypothetical protein
MLKIYTNDATISLPYPTNQSYFNNQYYQMESWPSEIHISFTNVDSQGLHMRSTAVWATSCSLDEEVKRNREIMNGLHIKEKRMKSDERIMQTGMYANFSTVKNVVCQQQNLWCNPFYQRSGICLIILMYLLSQMINIKLLTPAE